VIRLVVGLGNPGKEHERTRHNAGFWLVERFAQTSGFALRKDPKFKALVGKNAGGAWFLLPQSYMNLSGQPVQMLAGFFKFKPEEILVVHDELDFAPGVARVKQGGGIAGHNGLRSISQHVGNDYRRVRIGVGHPGVKDLVHAHVLSDFAKSEREWVETLCDVMAENAGLLAQAKESTFQNKVHLAMTTKGFGETKSSEEN